MEVCTLKPNQSNIADCDRMHATMHCATINVSLLFDKTESAACSVLACPVNTVYRLVVSFLYPVLGFNLETFNIYSAKDRGTFNDQDLIRYCV
jgi:hypothetical protein